MGFKSIQPNSSQGGLDMGIDLNVVILEGQRFHAAQVFRLPDVQPLPQCHFAGSHIGTGCNGGSRRLELLTDFLLGFPGDGLLNLFSGSRVKSHRIAGFPENIILSVAGNSLFPNGADSCGTFFALRHDFSSSRRTSRYRMIVAEVQQKDNDAKRHYRHLEINSVTASLGIRYFFPMRMLRICPERTSAYAELFPIASSGIKSSTLGRRAVFSDCFRGVTALAVFSLYIVVPFLS